MAVISRVDGTSFELPRQCVVGRMGSCNLMLDHPTVSGMHATIAYADGDWRVRDLGSRNGTRVGGVLLPPAAEHVLEPGARIMFGEAETWLVRTVDPPGAYSMVPWRPTDSPEAAQPSCILRLFVSRDGRELDLELCADGRSVPVTVDGDALGLLMRLQDGATDGREEASAEAAWVTTTELGVSPDALTSELGRIESQLALPGLARGGLELFERRDDGAVRLASGRVERIVAQENRLSIGSSHMTALERTLYLDPPAGLINLTYGYPEGQSPSWIEQCRTTPPAPGQSWSHRRALQDYFTGLFGLETALLTTTATEALLVAIRAALRGVGDEIIVLENGFDAYPGLIEMCGAVPRFVPRSEGHRLLPDAVAKAVRSRTAAVLLTSPDNPTGVIHDAAALSEVGRRCAARRIPLILDAVFHEVTPGHARPATPGAWAPASLDLMVIGDTGKILGLRGTKLGALVSSSRLAERAAAVADNLFFQLPETSLSTIANILSDARYPAYLTDFLGSLQRNWEILRDGVGPGVSILPSEATSMALIDVSGLGIRGTEFADRLLEEERVATVACESFARGAQRPMTHLVRVALARPGSEMREAASRIERLRSRLCRRAEEPRRSTRHERHTDQQDGNRDPLHRPQPLAEEHPGQSNGHGAE